MIERGAAPGTGTGTGTGAGVGKLLSTFANETLNEIKMYLLQFQYTLFIFMCACLPLPASACCQTFSCPATFDFRLFGTNIAGSLSSRKSVENVYRFSFSGPVRLVDFFFHKARADPREPDSQLAQWLCKMFKCRH